MFLPKKIALPALAFLVAFPVLLSSGAFAHGPAPNWCSNYYGDNEDVEYPAAFTSFIVDNGNHTYDVLTDPDPTIQVVRERGYNVDFVMHTEPYGARVESNGGNYKVVQANSSDIEGYIWQRDFMNGYPFSRCMGPVQGDQDFAVSTHVPISHMFQGDGPHRMLFETTLGDPAEFYIQLVNETAEEPTAPPQDNQTAGSLPPQDNDAEDETDEEIEEEPEDSDQEGTVHSPFVFRNENTAASVTITGDIIEDAPEITVLPATDALHINGTLASYHFLNGTQAPRLHVLSGNWSMAMNDTSATGFGANFTMVRSDGLERQEFSLGNLTVVSDSDMSLTGGTMSMKSALDYYAGGETTRVNATITVHRLNVIVIELEGAGRLETPVYGVVDKVIRSEGGQAQVMSRQFDMI